MKNYANKIISVLSVVLVMLIIISSNISPAEDRSETAVTAEHSAGEETAGSDAAEDGEQEETLDSAAYLRKIWIADEGDRTYGETFDFIITKMEDGKIGGFIAWEGGVEKYYWQEGLTEFKYYSPFMGTIDGNKAECVFRWRGQVQLTLVFDGDDRIKAEMTCNGSIYGTTNIHESHWFRPYHLSDVADTLNNDLSYARIDLDSRGTVNLYSATANSPYYCSCIYLTDEKGNILYELTAAQDNYDLEFWDVYVEDINKDGLQDIWIVAGEQNAMGDGKQYVFVFYQTQSGRFLEEDGSTESMPETYYGTYAITKSCPVDYEENRNQSLTEQEADAMSGSRVIIQENLFATCDLQWRQGLRNGRQQVQENHITSIYQEICSGYVYKTISSGMVMDGSKISYDLTNIVGDEYADRINGMFWNPDFETQRFFTMEDTDDLIMYSLQSGQAFILVKKEDNGQTEAMSAGIAIYPARKLIQKDGNYESVKYPYIEIETEPETAGLINQQIHDMVVPEDFGQYISGAKYTEIHYDTEFPTGELWSIHVQGAKSLWDPGSGAISGIIDQGLNFDLRTGRLVSLRDYYSLSELREIVESALEHDEIGVLDPYGYEVSEDLKDITLQTFAALFDTEEYSRQADVFYLRGDKIYFIPSNIDVCVEMELECFGRLWCETDSPYTSAVVSDFLSLNAEKFEQKYDRKELYEKDILYCDQNAWKYDGNAVDIYQKPEEHYDVAGITAIRFIKHSYTPGYTDAQADDREISIQCFDDYAISMFYQKKLDSQSGEEVLNLMEISYIKVETGGEKASKTFYQELENNYYQVRAEIQAGEWIASPDGTREVCVSNGALPKHPAQIFVRYRDKMPDSVFRMAWECGIAGWIDDEHIVCYEIDMSGPLLIHLETNQIEEIKKEDDDYDIYGAKYEIQDNQLVCTCMGEEIYCWNIVRGNGDIHIIKQDALLEVD